MFFVTTFIIVHFSNFGFLFHFVDYFINYPKRVIELETTSIQNLSSKLSSWRRFVDDSICFVKKDSIKFVLDNLNNFHKNLILSRLYMKVIWMQLSEMRSKSFRSERASVDELSFYCIA